MAPAMLAGPLFTMCLVLLLGLGVPAAIHGPTLPGALAAASGVLPAPENSATVGGSASTANAPATSTRTTHSSASLPLLRADEYIDLDESSVKLLGKTKPGVSVAAYLGDSPQTLKLVETVADYDNQGFTVTGLKPGTRYYYQLVATQPATKTQAKVVTRSAVLSFTKLALPETPPPAPAWAKTAVFYEVFVRAFADGNGDGIGDLAGLKQRLPYLRKLGVTALWLMPIFASPSYHGYDIEDYYKINPDYGTNAQFFDFLNEAHAQGFRVILDLVINHTSAQHPWFRAASSPIDAANAATNRYRNYYVWADSFDDITQLAPTGQSLWHRNPDSLGPISKSDFYQAVFNSSMPELNFRLPDVRSEIKKIARYWLDPNGDGNPADGVDGFRLDAAQYIDLDPQVTHAWWRQFNRFVKSINPNAFLVAENWAAPAIVAPYLGDLESSFNFRLADLILAAANGQGGNLLNALDGIHNLYDIFSSDYIDATFLSNHDQTRVATRLLGDPARLRLAAAILLTLPGTPFIYYGEELGQPGDKPDESIREPFDWYAAGRGPGLTNMLSWTAQPVRYDQPNDGISVQEEETDPNSLLNYYRKLIAIRKANPILFSGQYTPLAEPALGGALGGALAYTVTAPAGSATQPDSRPATAGVVSANTDTKASGYGGYGGYGYTLMVVHNTTAETIRVPVDSGGTELLTGRVLTPATQLVLAPGDSAIIQQKG